jgi:hypothetical protein
MESMESTKPRKQPARRAKLHHLCNCESLILQVLNTPLGRRDRESKQIMFLLRPRCLPIDFRDISTREVRIPSPRSNFTMSFDKIVLDNTCPAYLFFSTVRSYHNDTQADLWISPAAEIFGAGHAMLHERSANTLGLFLGDRQKGRIPFRWLPRGLAPAYTHIKGHPTKAWSAIKATTLIVSDADHDRCKVWLQQRESAYG